MTIHALDPLERLDTADALGALKLARTSRTKPSAIKAAMYGGHNLEESMRARGWPTWTAR